MTQRTRTPTRATAAPSPAMTSSPASAPSTPSPSRTRSPAADRARALGHAAARPEQGAPGGRFHACLRERQWR